jgi:hypothetical protein
MLFGQFSETKRLPIVARKHLHKSLFHSFLIILSSIESEFIYEFVVIVDISTEPGGLPAPPGRYQPEETKNASPRIHQAFKVPLTLVEILGPN